MVLCLPLPMNCRENITKINLLKNIATDVSTVILRKPSPFYSSWDNPLADGNRQMPNINIAKLQIHVLLLVLQKSTNSLEKRRFALGSPG